ncbi:MAG: hypothetical protein LBU00_02705 [Treponema sp.]|jgi:hypothetical protein|nr:hypothetical protein [Treponema sp.]
MAEQALARRVLVAGKREATVLEQDGLRLVIDDEGGMVSELSAFTDKGGRLNAHWNPWFRGLGGKPFDTAEHGAFWKARLLYQLAGNFPCLPSFGGDHLVDGIDMPAHGWTANNRWCFLEKKVDKESGAAWALSAMGSPERPMPLGFKKIDMVIPGHPVHYTAIVVGNTGDRDIDISAGWHNTVGAPFLAPGCRYNGAGETWMTAPAGGEFDATSRLAMGEQFSSLTSVPLRNGTTADISVIPGPIGYTDFVTGAIPARARIGWSAVVNPFLKMLYLCFFTGPAAAAADDIILYFNELWMQYGGRPFTPWAAYDGGTDLTYCLGTENVVSAYAYGLDYSRKAGTLLGNPTTVTIPAGGIKTLRYATLFTPYTDTALDNGVSSLNPTGGGIVAAARNGGQAFTADWEFKLLKKIEKGSYHADLGGGERTGKTRV